MIRFQIAASVVLGLALAGPAYAQTPPGSQHGTLSQKINNTTISIAYDRPVARGRTLFGELVPFDKLWSPAANRAAILELDKDATIAGQPVPAGKYSVFTIPGRDEWTVIINRTWDVHHFRYAGESSDVFRVNVKPETGQHMETLAFYFPVVGPYNATLNLHWGTTIVPISIEVAH